MIPPGTVNLEQRHCESCGKPYIIREDRTVLFLGATCSRCLFKPEYPTGMKFEYEYRWHTNPTWRRSASIIVDLSSTT